MNKCLIIDYEDRYQKIFRSLNEEWLDHYHLKESHDLAILDDPRKMIIDNGGVIFLAKVGDEIIGTAALMKEHGNVYELVKMGVAQNFRKQGIGNMLLEKCLNAGQERGAEKIVLFSNHQLTSALKLYEKYGFTYIPVENSPFATADIKMELVL